MPRHSAEHASRAVAVGGIWALVGSLGACATAGPGDGAGGGASSGSAGVTSHSGTASGKSSHSGGGGSSGTSSSGSNDLGSNPGNPGSTGSGSSTGENSSSGSAAASGSASTGSQTGASGSTSGDPGGTSGQASTGSSAGSTGSTGSPVSSGPPSPGGTPPDLPKVMGACPTFMNGATVTVNAGGGSIQAQIWMGNQGGGPIVIYWHGTASSPGGEIPIAFDTNAVAAAGGIIVGFNANSRTGATNGNTGDAVWYQSDLAFADQAVACAIQNNHGDPTHIHTAGYSAGGLQTVYMWYARSGYLASVISYSGGSAVINQAPMQNNNLPSAIAAHGAPGQDNLVVDFANASVSWEMAIKMAGGFSIDCNDGGNHLDFFGKRAPGLKPVAFKFFQDHPYGVKPDPYASALPAGFPSYCKID
ncbi:MAG TPA: hypothetical protein VKU41_03440 [Polyangiaceae bacterium]|nr:hypothetical protein [Polyangiaceae bacterium]